MLIIAFRFAFPSSHVCYWNYSVTWASRALIWHDALRVNTQSDWLEKGALKTTLTLRFSKVSVTIFVLALAFKLLFRQLLSFYWIIWVYIICVLYCYFYYWWTQLLTLQFRVVGFKPEKKSGLNGIRTHDLCDSGAVPERDSNPWPLRYNCLSCVYNCDDQP